MTLGLQVAMPAVLPIEELGVSLIPVDISYGMSRSTESSSGGGVLWGDRLETARHMKKAGAIGQALIVPALSSLPPFSDVHLCAHQESPAVRRKKVESELQVAIYTGKRV